MEFIGSLFEHYVIILYYDTSTDHTLNKIRQYQLKNDKLQIIINTDPPLEYRTHRIAKGRNACLDMIKTAYSDYEYFIMMDCDDICFYNIKLPLLKHYLDKDNNASWDSLSFNHPAGIHNFLLIIVFV